VSALISDPIDGSNLKIAAQYDRSSTAILFGGPCLDLLRQIPAEAAQLIVTSPPYNIGKEYEKRMRLDRYIEEQTGVIRECVRILGAKGSLCWQVGNYVDDGAIVPLDALLYPVFARMGLQLRNRIVWHFEHGLHCSRRFSGRYETIMWWTRSEDYVFDLDPVRIPQKYPGKKHFKGPRSGQFSSNPLGKNPGDVWIIPNVKSNHIEKTAHPCQYPVELVERLVLSMTQPGDLIVDPFVGSGTSIIAAIRHGRRGCGAETVADYIEIAKDRIAQELRGELKTRPMGKPVFDPAHAGESLRRNPWSQLNLPEAEQ
jgi:adenine-specific DNA-methyltransferase